MISGSETYANFLEDSDLPESEAIVELVWRSLSFESAERFMLLDMHLLQDELSRELGDDVAGRLDAAGFLNLGDVVGVQADDVAARVTLTPAERQALGATLATFGLAFAEDVSAWREYRQTVPRLFRLRRPYASRFPQDTRKAFDT